MTEDAARAGAGLSTGIIVDLSARDVADSSVCSSVPAVKDGGYQAGASTGGRSVPGVAFSDIGSKLEQLKLSKGSGTRLRTLSTS